MYVISHIAMFNMQNSHASKAQKVRVQSEKYVLALLIQ